MLQMCKADRFYYSMVLGLTRETDGLSLSLSRVVPKYSLITNDTAPEGQNDGSQVRSAWLPSFHSLIGKYACRGI